MIPICFQLHRFRYLRAHDEHLDWEKLINGHQEILNAILHSNVYLADARIFNHLHLMLVKSCKIFLIILFTVQPKRKLVHILPYMLLENQNISQFLP